MARRPGAWVTRRGDKWRLIVRRPGGGTTSATYATEAQARRVAIAYQQQLELGDLSVEEALKEYRRHLIEKGNKPSSITTTMHRLRPLASVGLMASLKRRAIEPLLTGAVDTRKNALGQWRTFFRWCCKQGYLKRDPSEGVEVVGRRRRGKEQLTVDECRALLEHCLSSANTDDGALAAACALLLGLRAGELADLRVRDLDAGGSVLLVARAKTRAGIRRVAVPEVLRVPLLLRGGRRLDAGIPRAGLLDLTRYGVLYHVKRLCREAGVPEVTAHGLRGTHATLATEAGVTGPLVAAALGHESETVTQRHYIADGTTEQAQRQRALRVLQGGRP